MTECQKQKTNEEKREENKRDDMKENKRGDMKGKKKGDMKGMKEPKEIRKPPLNFPFWTIALSQGKR